MLPYESSSSVMVTYELSLVRTATTPVAVTLPTFSSVGTISMVSPAFTIPSPLPLLSPVWSSSIV